MHCLSRLLILALTALTVSAWADVFNINDSERGYVCSSTTTLFCPAAGNNGTSAGNSYIAGVVSNSSGTDLGEFRNWFEFSIPSLSGGSLVSASLSLDVGGHGGGNLSYAVYGLGGKPSIFTAVTTSNPFGSINTTNGSAGTTISIQLNAAALAAIVADQGGNIFIGGIDSGETVADPNIVSPSTDFVGDFGNTLSQGPPAGQSYNVVLDLTTAPASVPEPSSAPLFLTAIFAGGLVTWRRKIRAH